jgi:hypothetical protein
MPIRLASPRAGTPLMTSLPRPLSVRRACPLRVISSRLLGNAPDIAVRMATGMPD